MKPLYMTDEEYNERNLVAVSIKHTMYGWKLGKPCILWGERTKDGEKRSFSGYTQYLNNAELYSLKDWHESGYGKIIKMNEPVKIEVGFCKKWRDYDTVLVKASDYLEYCKFACLALERYKQ